MPHKNNNQYKITQWDTENTYTIHGKVVKHLPIGNLKKQNYNWYLDLVNILITYNNSIILIHFPHYVHHTIVNNFKPF